MSHIALLIGEIGLPQTGFVDCEFQKFQDKCVWNKRLGYEIIPDPGHKPVKHEYQDPGMQYIFRLIGGPTGYESFYISQTTLKMIFTHGWLANAGNKNYDRCFIPGSELKANLSRFREVSS